MFYPAVTDVDRAECAQQDAVAGHTGDMPFGVVRGRLSLGADSVHRIQKSFAFLCGQVGPAFGELAAQLCHKVKIDMGVQE